MRGSKDEVRPGVWRLRVYTGQRRTTENGDYPVLVQRTIKGGIRKAEGELTKLLGEVETGYRGEHGATFDALVVKWMEHLEATDRRPYTLTGYRRKLDKHILPIFGKVAVAAITAEDLDAAYRRWRRAGLSSTTVHGCHAIIASAMHQAAKWRWVKESPTKLASPPSARRLSPGSISVAELQALVHAADWEKDEKVLGTAIALGAVTGCRRGELCALRWSAVDLKANELRISESLTVIPGEPWSVGPTKTHQVRVLSLDDAVKAFLSVRWDEQRKYAAKVGVELVADPFILSRHADGAQPCMPDGLSHGFRRVADELGIPYHFHSLRHFAATEAIAAGHNVRAVAQQLGHADPSMTLRVYTHARSEASRAIGKTLGDALGRPAPKELPPAPD